MYIVIFEMIDAYLIEIMKEILLLLTLLITHAKYFILHILAGNQVAQFLAFHQIGTTPQRVRDAEEGYSIGYSMSLQCKTCKQDTHQWCVTYILCWYYQTVDLQL